MKTFKQYIEETVDFRLGGSANKGVKEYIGKTFRELEIGDVVYIWRVEPGNHVKKMIFNIRKNFNNGNFEGNFGGTTMKSTLELGEECLDFSLFGKRWSNGGCTVWALYEMTEGEIIDYINSDDESISY